MWNYIQFTLFHHLVLFSGGILAVLCLVFGFLFVFSDIKARKEHASVPSSLPWIGTNPQAFSAVRANFRGLVDSVALYTKGYNQFSKMDKVFVVPTWTKGPQIILPPSMANWLATRPDTILNAKDCTLETLQFDYTIRHPEIAANDMIQHVIKRKLTRTVGELNNELLEEIESSMADIFGTDCEWREVGVFDNMTLTVGRVANRIFVGKELCSNMDFVMASIQFTKDISISSYILHLFPKFMKPAVSWLATIPNRRHSGIAMQYLEPIVKTRIEDMKRKDMDPTYAWEEPNNFISWMVRESFKRDKENETSAYALAYSMVLLNVAGIMGPSMMITNTILDIWSTPNSAEIVEALREEASCALQEHNGEWTKAAVEKLFRLDSAIRESSRISGIGGTAMPRRVRADNGITLPNGLVVPKNTTLGVSMDGLHLDDTYYDRPKQFDPFRFSRAREELGYDKKLRGKDDLVTTSVHWLTFSHGIHSCDARFFVANEVKMILAYIILNYDIQAFPSRPPNISVGDIVVPGKAKMKMRRRYMKA